MLLVEMYDTKDRNNFQRGKIRRMCDYELTEGSRIRIMPDVHAGKILLLIKISRRIPAGFRLCRDKLFLSLQKVCSHAVHHSSLNRFFSNSRRPSSLILQSSLDIALLSTDR